MDIELKEPFMGYTGTGVTTGPKIASASMKLLTPFGLADNTARRGFVTQPHHLYKGQKEKESELCVRVHWKTLQTSS